MADVVYNLIRVTDADGRTVYLRDEEADGG